MTQLLAVHFFSSHCIADSASSVPWNMCQNTWVWHGTMPFGKQNNEKHWSPGLAYFLPISWSTSNSQIQVSLGPKETFESVEARWSGFLESSPRHVSTLNRLNLWGASWCPWQALGLCTKSHPKTLYTSALQRWWIFICPCWKNILLSLRNYHSICLEQGSATHGHVPVVGSSCVKYKKYNVWSSHVRDHAIMYLPSYIFLVYPFAASHLTRLILVLSYPAWVVSAPAVTMALALSTWVPCNARDIGSSYLPLRELQGPTEQPQATKGNNIHL